MVAVMDGAHPTKDGATMVDGMNTAHTANQLVQSLLTAVNAQRAVVKPICSNYKAKAFLFRIEKCH